MSMVSFTLCTFVVYFVNSHNLVINNLERSNSTYILKEKLERECLSKMNFNMKMNQDVCKVIVIMFFNYLSLITLIDFFLV